MLGVRDLLQTEPARLEFMLMENFVEIQVRVQERQHKVRGHS